MGSHDSCGSIAYHKERTPLHSTKASIVAPRPLTILTTPIPHQAAPLLLSPPLPLSQPSSPAAGPHQAPDLPLLRRNRYARRPPCSRQ